MNDDKREVASFKWLEYMMGEEWRNDLTPTQNIVTLIEEVRHWRKLMGTLETFENDLIDWLDEYEGSRRAPSTEKNKTSDVRS